MTTIAKNSSIHSKEGLLKRLKQKCLQIFPDQLEKENSPIRTDSKSYQDSLIIHWKNVNNRICLHFTFQGILSYELAMNGVNEWRKHFQGKEKLKIVIVWDCIKMTGYEPRSRIIWQKALKEMKEQIDTIWLISNSPIIKTGAKIMSLAVSYDIKGISKETDII